jgi:hypothetical protein
MTRSNNYFSLISVNVKRLNSLIKRHRLTEWLHKQDPTNWKGRSQNITISSWPENHRAPDGRPYPVYMSLKKKVNSWGHAPIFPKEAAWSERP